MRRKRRQCQLGVLGTAGGERAERPRGEEHRIRVALRKDDHRHGEPPAPVRHADEPAAEAERPVEDSVLTAAVIEMLSDSEQLTRALLGGTPQEDGQMLPDGDDWHPRSAPGLAPS